MESKERYGKRRRKKHLRPLCDMPVWHIVGHIESLNLNQLRALKRAMDSCTTTNCWWGEYDIAGRFYSDVQKQINLKATKKRKAANKSKAVC